MKRQMLFFIACLCLAANSLQAQWTNSGSSLYTFDNVGIDISTPLEKFHVEKGNILVTNYSPQLLLRRDRTTGGFTQGIHTQLSDGSTNYWFGNLHSQEWRVSKGSWDAPIFRITGVGDIVTNGHLNMGPISGHRATDSNKDFSTNYYATGTSTSEPTLIHPAGRIWAGHSGFNQGWHGQKLVLEAAHGWSQNNYVKHQLVLRGNGNILIGASSEKWANQSNPTPSNSRLYIKNDNDEMLAFERDGVSHIYEFRMGGDGKLILGKRSGVNNAQREVVMEFESDNNNKRVEFLKYKVYAREVEVNVNGAAPDYVFAKDYDLMPIDEVEAFVKANHHLPNFPKGEAYEEHLELGTMTFKLIEKLEELTLYTIEQEKRIEALEKALETK